MSRACSPTGNPMQRSTSQAIAESLEPRRCLSTPQGAAVLAADRDVLAADRHTLNYDLQQIRLVAATDRAAIQATTRFDDARLHADRLKLIADRQRDPGAVVNDLSILQSDEQLLRTDILAARTKAANDRAALLITLQQDRLQWKADYKTYIADGG